MCGYHRGNCRDSHVNMWVVLYDICTSTGQQLGNMINGQVTRLGRECRLGK